MNGARAACMCSVTLLNYDHLGVAEIYTSRRLSVAMLSFKERVVKPPVSAYAPIA